MPIRAAIRSITRISPLHETHAGIPKMNADYQPGQKPTMANRHVAGFVAPAFVRPRKTTARRSEVSYVPSSVRNERSDHSSVTCAGGSRARCCVENMLVAPVWGNKNQPGSKTWLDWNSAGRMDVQSEYFVRRGFHWISTATRFSERAVRFLFSSTSNNSTIRGSSAVDSFKLSRFPLLWRC